MPPTSTARRPRLRAGVVTTLLLLLTVTGLQPAQAATDVVLADFETVDSLAGVTTANAVDHVALSPGVAVTGASSMRLDVPGKDTVSNQPSSAAAYLPASALQPADWGGHTYLHLGLANSFAYVGSLIVAVRDIAGHRMQVTYLAQPFEYHAFEIKTADLAAAGVDLTRLQRIEILTVRGIAARSVYVDDIRLSDTVADADAERRAIAPGLIRSMGIEGRIAVAEQQLGELDRRISPSQQDPDRTLRARSATLHVALATLGQRLSALGDDVPAAWKLGGDVDTFGWTVKRFGSQVDARAAAPGKDVGLGWADSMSMVYPRDLPCHCTYGDGHLELARGEYESTQLVALPYTGGIADAQVRVAAVHGPDAGRGLSITSSPVASVNMAPPVDAKAGTPTAWRPAVYQSWTPDPILTDRQSVTVAGDDLQSFWVQVKADAGAHAGTYVVDLELSGQGISTQHAKLSVTVWDVTLSDRPMLRTAIGNDPKAYAEPWGVTDPAGLAKLNDAKWSFLADFKLQPDNIYRSIYDGAPPSVADLRKIQESYGGLRQFNIWYFDPRLFNLGQPGTWAAQADALFDKIQPAVDSYRAAGLIDKAYFYCCDESRSEYFGLIRTVLTRFKTRFPDIRVLTTAIDDQEGLTNGLAPLMDWWVRDVPWYSKAVIDQRHAQGLESWWYLHAGVNNPYPNLFVGYDPGQMRTLLGPMSFQAGVAGFLYYRVDRWYGRKPITDGPLTSYDPRSFGNVAGDGSLLYPGRTGPISSIRLQNMRDGLEDYNLLAGLRAAIDQAGPGTSPTLLTTARQLVSAAAVVTNQTTYERDPAAYRAWRDDVGETISRLR